MANLRMLDMQVIDDLFERPSEPGYVLDFSDKTFRIFFCSRIECRYRRPDLRERRYVKAPAPKVLLADGR